jgi:hypothetical protein
MPGAASNYLENKILDHCLRYGTAPFTAPSTLYLALFTADPGETGSFTAEISSTGTAYARQSVTFAAASGGSCTNSATVTFPIATASWGTITHVAITDSATRGAGNILFYSAVTTSKLIDVSDQFQITSGNLTISLD